MSNSKNNRISLHRVRKIAFVLVGAALLLTACTLPINSFAQLIMGNSAPLNTSLAPADHGLPDSIAGYKIILVQTSETTACIPSGEIRVTLLTSAPNVQSFLASADPGDVLQALKQINPNVNWSIEFASVDASLEDTAAAIARWNAMMAAGCVHLGPIIVPTPSQSEHS